MSDKKKRRRLTSQEGPVPGLTPVTTHPPAWATQGPPNRQPMDPDAPTDPADPPPEADRPPEAVGEFHSPPSLGDAEVIEPKSPSQRFRQELTTAPQAPLRHTTPPPSERRTSPDDGGSGLPAIALLGVAGMLFIVCGLVVTIVVLVATGMFEPPEPPPPEPKELKPNFQRPERPLPPPAPVPSARPAQPDAADTDAADTDATEDTTP